MDNLLTRLQTEVGLTEEQAKKAVETIRKYMSDNNIQFDLNGYIENKAKEITTSSKKFLTDFFGKVDQWSEKAQEKLEDISDKTQEKFEEIASKAKDKYEDLSDKTKQTVDDAKKKASDLLDDANKENTENNNNSTQA